MSHLSTRSNSYFPASIPLTPGESQPLNQSKSKKAIFLQELNANYFSTSLPSQPRTHDRSTKSNQSFRIPTVHKSDFLKLLSPNSSTTPFNEPNNLQEPNAPPLNLNIFTKKDKNSSLSSLPCPSISGIVNNLYKKKNGNIFQHTQPLPEVQPQKSPQQTRLTGYSLKKHVGQPVGNRDHSMSINNQPSIEEDFMAMTSERFAQDKKNATRKNVIKKVPYSPARVFAISKGEMEKTMRDSTEVIRFKPMTSQGQKKKPTILSLIKDKVEEAHKGNSNDLQKIIHRPFLSVRIPGKSNPLSVSNFFENRNVEKASPIPLEETQKTPLGTSGLFKKSDTISPESPTRKKDMRMARGFNSNFAMAKIERIALKELKFRKEQAKNNGNEGRMHPIEEVDFSPLKGKPSRYFHPLFQNNNDDDDEVLLKNKKNGKDNKFFSRSFRKKLIKVLIKMRRLKLTPKDLLKNQKIFSLVPFEKEGSKKFIYAAKTGNFSLVKEYIEKKNRFLVYDFDQVHQTALHWATRNGYPEIVEYLIEKGADVDAKDISGRTPLFFALKNNDILATKYLLGNQADPWSTKDCDYKALSKNNPTVKHYITKAKQLHILMKMTPPALRELLWEKEGLRLIVNMTFNIDERRDD